VDDHISKLEHMGKETVKKLQDIHAAAEQCNTNIHVPDNCINKGRWGCCVCVCVCLCVCVYGVVCVRLCVWWGGLRP
jgi:hypothetical protein